MKIALLAKRGRRRRLEGSSLVEIVIALALSVLAAGALVDGYVMCTRQAESSSFVYAAQCQALGRLEETRAARWDRVSATPEDLVQQTNFPPVVRVLDIPRASVTVYGTNYTTITQIAPNLKLVEVSCVWPWLNGKVYTNTVATYRAPDQ